MKYYKESVVKTILTTNTSFALALILDDVYNKCLVSVIILNQVETKKCLLILLGAGKSRMKAQDITMMN